MNAIAQALHVKQPTGLWLIHGDEPLVASWLLDNWRVFWNAEQVERKRYDLTANKTSTWLEALNEFDMLSLFSSQTIVELYGNTKPDKKGLARLKDFCEQPNDNCLIVIMPTQDWKAKKTVFFQTCMQLGTVVDTTLKNEQERKDLLSLKAQKFGLNLAHDAWQLLLEETQNNLLSAYQALWRMSDLAVIHAGDTIQDVTPVTVEMLKPALVAQSRYNQYDLADHVLQGNVAKVVEILSYLKESGEQPSLILWNLAKDARIITQLVSHAQVKIPSWQLKKYNRAVARTSVKNCQQWHSLLLEIDKSIKGLSAAPAWELLLQLSLSMAGKHLFLK